MPSSAPGGWEKEDVLVGKKVNTDSVFASSGKSPGIKHVCPFCGCVSDSAETACPQCGLEDSSATRQATRAKIGPWYVLQSRNPAAPGMNFETLLSLLRKGRITQRSVVRGPTTHQLWRQASRVRGLSRELGVCWGCGQGIEHDIRSCPQCGRSQEPPAYPDELLERRSAPEPAAVPAAAPSASASSATPSTAISASNSLPVPAMHSPTTGEPDADAVRMALATFRLPADYAMGTRAPHRGRQFIVGVFVVLLLSGAALALAAWFLPPVRADVVAWWHKTFPNSTMESPQTPPPTIPLPDLQPQPPTEILAHDPAPAIIEAPPASPSITTGAPPLNIPAITLIPPAPIAPPPVATSTPAIVPEAAPPEIASPINLDAAKQQASLLWSEAVDAEQKGQYAQAVQYYRQIKQLPASVWQPDLDVRLNRTMKALSEPQ